MGALGDLAALQEQFHAQLAALGALQEGRVPPENTVLAACGGKIPLAAAAELAEAAAAYRQQQAAAMAALGSAAPDTEAGQLQQEGAMGASAGQQPAAGSSGSRELPEAEQLQQAIRDKLRRLAPQKRKVQQEVLLERSLGQQCSEFQLMDWRRMRRPLPGSNPKAFEPPMQPTALLMQQAAVRAQRAAMAARADKLRQQRAYLERQQREQQQWEQQQQQQAQQQQQQRQEEEQLQQDGASLLAAPRAQVAH